MEGLLRRIAAEGSEAENALRVVAFFDELVAHRSSPDALVRSTARLIGAPAGFISDSGNSSWSFDSRGRQLGPGIPVAARVLRVTIDGGFVGNAWILPETSNYTLAELVLERMAMSAGIILGRDSGESAHVQASSLSRLVDPGTPASERVADAQALGFRDSWLVRAIVAKEVETSDRFHEAVRVWSRSLNVKCTAPITDGDLHIVLVHETGKTSFKGLTDWSGLIAMGPRVNVWDASVSLAAAREALRLTSRTLGPHSLDYEQLGPLRFLAAVPPAEAAEDALVKELVLLCHSHSGRAQVHALDSFCRNGSLRAAAAELSLHHSSLANRLENISQKLGFDLSDSEQRLSISMSLFLFRVACSG
jgi:hypothetical protein